MQNFIINKIDSDIGKLLRDFFIKKELVIEEADFGAHCENSSQDNISQLKKIHSIVNKYNVENIYVTTGTGYEKLLKFVSNENYKVFTKDYFVDILGE